MPGTLFTKRATSGRNTIAKILPGTQLVFSDLLLNFPCPLLNINYLVARSVIRSNIYWVFFQKSRSVLSAVCVPSYALLPAARLWATAVQTFKFLLCCVTWVSTFLSHGTLRGSNIYNSVRRGDLTYIDEPIKNGMKCGGTSCLTTLLGQRCYRSRDQLVYINEGPRNCQMPVQFYQEHKRQAN